MHGMSFAYQGCGDQWLPTCQLWPQLVVAAALQFYDMPHVYPTTGDLSRERDMHRSAMATGVFFVVRSSFA